MLTHPSPHIVVIVCVCVCVCVCARTRMRTREREREMRAFTIYFQISSLQYRIVSIHNKLSIRASKLTTENLHPWIHISQFPPSPVPDNYQSTLHCWVQLCVCVCFSQFPFISVIMEYLFFSLWLISFSLIQSRFIHVGPNGRISFFVIAEHTTCFTYLLICQQKGYFHTLAIVNNATINTGVQISFQNTNFVSFGCIPRNGIYWIIWYFYFLRNLYSVFQPSVYSHHQCTRVPFSP